MNADSHFVCGKSHQVCQDYTITNEVNFYPFVALADGCSSSKLTDVGARLLLHAASNKLGPLTSFLPRDEEDIHSALIRALASSHDAASLLGLPHECLDATLMLCMPSIDPIIAVIVVGDGVIAARRKDGIVKLEKIEYPNNSPEYLNYCADPIRRRRYLKEFGNLKTFDSVSYGHSSAEPPLMLEGEHTVGRTVELEVFRFFDTREYDLVAVMSDGVGSFDGVEWHKVASELVAFKNTTGAFVQRRLKRVIKDYQDQNIHHYDDISMAAIFID